MAAWAQCECDARSCFDRDHHRPNGRCPRAASERFAMVRGSQRRRLCARCRVVYLSEMGYSLQRLDDSGPRPP